MPAKTAFSLVNPADHRVMPWKNGLGTTREIAIDPPDAGLSDRFRWRLSIAEVRDSGPFSAFAGYDRTIMVIEGAGMELSAGGRPLRRLADCFVPFTFSGDLDVDCRLIDGPIRDFNLMTDRHALRGRFDVVHVDASSQFVSDRPGTWVFHGLAGIAEITGGETVQSCSLPPGHSAIGEFGGSPVRSLQLKADLHAVVGVIFLESIGP